MRESGDGTFQAAQSYAAGSAPNSVAVGDFNRDGHLDLAVANLGTYPNYNGTVSVLLGNGDGTFQAARSHAAGVAFSVVVGDFNGDGFPDLAVVAGPYPGAVSIFLGNGDGTFQAAQTYAAGSALNSVAVGDFNGDGFPDLAMANFYDGSVTVLLNAADWGSGPVPPPPPRPGLHRPVPSQLGMEPASALLAASEPQAQHPLSVTFTDLPPSPVGQWPLQAKTAQPARPEATFTPTAIVTARHAQDAVLERWGDGVLDALA